MFDVKNVYIVSDPEGGRGHKRPCSRKSLVPTRNLRKAVVPTAG